MKILKVSAKNFGSYGTQGIELDFSSEESNLSLIEGGNGQGKSTIMNLLSFSLYGKISEKKIKDIPNRFNDKCEVEIELLCNNHHVLIQRGLLPNYFRVAIDGDFGVGDRAGKLNVQDYLEEEIYNIPYHLFNNLISLSINDFKSFIKMSNKDKLDIIDKIFGLSIINLMYEYLKTDIKEIKDESKELNTKTLVLTEQIDTTTRELENLSNILTNDTQQRKEEIKTTIEKLGILKEQFIEEYSQLNEIITERNSIVQDLNKKIQSNNITLSKLEDKIKLYHLDKCPECGTNLQDDEHSKVLESYLKEKDKISSIKRQYMDELKKEDSETFEIKTKQNEVYSKLQKIDIKNKSFITELNDLSGLDKIDKQTSSMKRLIDESNKKLETVLKDKKKIDNKQNFYKIIDDILSEKGIKNIAMKSIIPGINSQIRSLIKELGLELYLEFNEEFDAKITHLGKEINSSTLSAGETKKLDFVVIIAIIKIMKIKFPGLNLLFLDEILSSLDQNSIFHLLKILSRISKENNLHIFVVHHAPLDNNIFDYVYHVNKINEFSILTKEKI